MKKQLRLTVLAFFCLVSGYAQNPYHYENKTVAMPHQYNGVEYTYDPNLFDKTLAEQNREGYKLISTAVIKTRPALETLILFFEKSDSYREKELYKLITELTTRIDAAAKAKTDSAMLVIQTNVLNYLKSIPNDVITQAYKDQLTKMIITEAEEKMKAVIEELKKEVRNSTTGKN